MNKRLTRFRKSVTSLTSGYIPVKDKNKLNDRIKHMELVEARRHVDNTNETNSIGHALQKLIDSKPSGGEISLVDFCKQVPTASRSDCVRILKKSASGIFITGRRGKPSRFVFGPPASPFMSRINNPGANTTKSHKTRPDKEDPVTVDKSKNFSPSDHSADDIPAARFELRVGVGGQITTIPITIALAVAA